VGTTTKIKKSSAKSAVRPRAELAEEASVAPGAVTGARVKQKRLERGWSLRHLAAQSGLAISTISKIENDKMAPTVDLFSRLLAALQTTPGEWFFDTSNAEDAFFKLQRAGSKTVIEHPAVRKEVLLGGSEHRDVLVMRMLYPPHAEVTEETVAHVGNEVVFVIRGILEMRFRGRKKVIMNPGDSLHFSSSIPRAYRAHGDEECEVMMVWRKKT